jgi:hypothetical protein
MRIYSTPLPRTYFLLINFSLTLGLLLKPAHIENVVYCCVTRKECYKRDIRLFIQSVNLIYPIHRNKVLYHRFYTFNIHLEYESDSNKAMRDIDLQGFYTKSLLFYFSLPE